MSFEVPDWDNSESFSYYNAPSIDPLDIIKKAEGQKGKRNLSDRTSDQTVKKPKISIAENTPEEVVSIEEKKKAKKKRQKELAAQRKKNEDAEQKQPNDIAAANENRQEVPSERKEKKCKNKYKPLNLEQKKRKEMENTEKQSANGTKTTENGNVLPTQKKKRMNSDTDKGRVTVNSVENGGVNKMTKSEKKKKRMKQLNGTVNDSASISKSFKNNEEELPETPKKRKKKSKKKDELIADALEMVGNNKEETEVDAEEKSLLQSSKKKNKRKAEKNLNGNALAIEVLGNNNDEGEVEPLQKKKKKKKNKKVDKNEKEELMQECDSEQEVTEYKIKGQKNKDTESTGKNKKNAKKKDVKSGGVKSKLNSQKEKKKKSSDNNPEEAEDLNDPSFQSDLDALLKKLNFEQFPDDILTLKGSDVQDVEEGSECLAESDIDTDDLYASTDEDDNDDDDGEDEDKNLQIEVSSNKKKDSVPQKGTQYENKKKIEAKSEPEKIEAKSEPPMTKKQSLPKNAVLQVSKQEEKSTKPARKEALKETKTSNNKENPDMNSAEALRQKMMDRLKGAQFRMMNEQLYTKTSKNAVETFKDDKDTFERYHEGFQTQVALWPINPLDQMITWLKKKPKDWVVADFGCGEARLAASVPQNQVHSFDLVAINERVTACDMAKTPLKNSSVDVVVFCLSLMGTNVKDFLVEASRVLKTGGIMKIAEVESRFKDVHKFVKDVSALGFECINKEIKQKYFFTFAFKKNSDCNKRKVPNIELKPCIYKKR